MKALNPKFYRIEDTRGQTGDQFERDFIGQIDTHSAEYMKARLQAVKEEEDAYKKGDWPEHQNPPTGGYIRIWKAMELARKFQQDNPTNPKKAFGKDIRIKIIELFSKHVFNRRATEEERARFKFFTAADRYKLENKTKYDKAKNDQERSMVPLSPADYFHGVDSWIEYTDENGNTLIATFDLTRDTAKDKKHVNDILVRMQELGDPNLEEEADKYEQKIEEIAKKSLEKMLYRELRDKKIIL